MAEDAELIGGLSVSLGADHSRLEADLAEANRLVHQWAKQVVEVELRARASAPAQQAAPQPVYVPQPQRQTISFGSRARGGARPEEFAAFERAVHRATGEMEDQAADAVQSVASAGRRAMEQAVGPQQIDVTLNTEKLNTELDAILGRLRSFREEAAALLELPAGGAGGGGGGKRRRGSRAATGDEDEGPSLDRPPRIRIVDQIERQRRASARGRTASPLDIDRAEQARNRQRERETPRLEQQERARQLSALSGINQSEAQAAARGGAGGFAPQRTAAQQRRFREEEERRAAQIEGASGADEARRARSDRLAQQTETMREEHAATSRRDEAERVVGGRGGGSRGSGGSVRVLTEEEITRRTEERIAARGGATVSGGRTQRTGVSAAGGFALGGGRERIRAEEELAAARQKVTVAQRNLNDAERSGDRVAIRHATEELTVAENNRSKALERVASFSTPLAGLRNLAAVTLAGNAFGLGLKTISIATDAAERALTPYFDRYTGYIRQTSALTGALADQAREQNGNVDAVTSLRLAQTGFSETVARTIQPLIAQRAQVEAGNKAIAEQIDILRAAENLRRQPGTAGLTSTTGGILGTPVFGTASTGEQIGNFLGQLGLATGVGAAGLNARGQFGPRTAAQGAAVAESLSQTPEGQAAQAALERGIAFVNDQMAKGGNSIDRFAQAADRLDPRVEQTARAFDGLSPEMAKAIRDNALYADSIRDVSDAIRSLQSINIAASKPDPNLLQQNFEKVIFPAMQRAAERQQEFDLRYQLPAQAALQNLVQPPAPIGTGIVARNADEQERIAAAQQKTGFYAKTTAEIQQDLNAYYVQGKQILLDTYKVPPVLLAQVEAIGKEIAATQAGIANQQAAYNVAQFNFQLQIARRTLSDINGLTGQNLLGAGQSYLGILEKQNLALGRQMQLIQFELAQRQINYNLAVAGFQAPGMTPEERQANVKAAQIEAEYAQKQLDIQEKMFGNQVQIVDIQNLRQGVDLAAQIGLLLQGRQVTIDTAVAQERLAKLQTQQQKLVAEVGTYLTKTNTLASAVMQQIFQIEAAGLGAVSRITTALLEGMGIYFTGVTTYLNRLGGRSSQDNSPDDRDRHASGLLGMTSGATDLGIAGEAGGEAVAILRNPRPFQFGSGGGGDVSINFYGDLNIRSDNDITELARQVSRELGREASLRGLRLAN